MAEIIARNDNELTIQVTVNLIGSLLEIENTIAARQESSSSQKR